MRILILIFLSFIIYVPSICQKIKTENINPANPVEDARQNYDSVRSALPIYGQFEKILVLRLKYNSDILAELAAAVKDQKIQNAVILGGIGSVKSYNYHVVGNRNFPVHNIFVKDTAASADILNINGYIVNGRVHSHISLSNSDTSFGGHLEAGTNVFTFAIITIGIFREGIDLSRIDDSTYR